MNQNNSEELIIVGGGITGLAAAYIAAKNGKKVTVLEAGKTFGGLLNTFEIGGNRLEFYYHHFFTHDAELNWLIKDLGIEKDLFFKQTSMGVFRNGKIFNFNGPMDLLKFSPINFIDKIKFGLTSLYLGKIAKWEKYEHISCMQWFQKWAGNSTTKSLWEPLLNIKFGPYADKVPLAWMVGRLRQRMNSRNNGGDEKLGYLQGSLQHLLDTLLSKLNEMGVQLINECAVENVQVNQNKISSLMTTKGAMISNTYLFTIPGTHITSLFKNNVPNIANQFEKIKYFGAVCVILEMKKALSDIYWLNIADEGFPFGGVIEHTNFISPKNYNGSHIAYLSRYFALEEPIAAMNEQEIKTLMISKLNKIYPNFDTNDLLNIFVFKTNSAATVCDLDFSKRIPNCKSEINNLYIANMSHVYPDERSTNNSIRVAAEACRVMGINSDFVPKNASLSGTIGF